MHTNIVHEYQSLRVILAITRVYRTSSSESKQIVRDIKHVIAAYDLCDKEAALACNRYITLKYPAIHKIAIHYGLHPMSQTEIQKRTESELQHMLYSLCIFLYDRLRMQTVVARIKIGTLYKQPITI